MRTIYLFDQFSFPSFLIILLMFISCQEPQKESQKRPNILLIMADDMGYSDIGAYGGEISTPNIDKLANNGVKFSQFYNGARCCPTRASLLTGLYAHQVGVGHMVKDRGIDAYRGSLNRQCVTIAEVLKEADYNTYMSGKWHLTGDIGYWSGEESLNKTENWPIQRGFDKFFGTLMSIRSYFDPPSLTRDNTPINPENDDFYYTDEISDNAVDYIQTHIDEDKSKPFFCYVAYTSPHWPLHALDEDIKKYDGVYDIGWDSLRTQRFNRMREMGILAPDWKLSDKDSAVMDWDQVENKEWQTRRMEVYAAMIDRMDQGIGRIISTLEDNNQLDNTLIIFLADNGGCAEEISMHWQGKFIPEKTRDGREVLLGNERTDVFPGPETSFQSYGLQWANVSNTPFRLYKHWVHEGGISTPMILHWPDYIDQKNQWVNTPSHLIDIMATCVDAAKTSYPDSYKGNSIIPVEGKSLLPLINGDKLEERPIFFEHEGNCAVRQGKWKLVKQYGGEWELYNMLVDRSETRNLAVEFPETVTALKARYEEWSDKVGVEDWATINQ